MDDLVERLRNPVWFMVAEPSGNASGVGTSVAKLDEQSAIAIMRDAADEIERLRSLAGALTPGKSFAEISDEVSARVIKQTHG